MSYPQDILLSPRHPGPLPGRARRGVDAHFAAVALMALMALMLIHCLLATALWKNGSPEYPQPVREAAREMHLRCKPQINECPAGRPGRAGDDRRGHGLTAWPPTHADTEIHHE